ncbi:hypothetical protein Tco_0819082 [Tanacetum coccineum]|uniref:Uncharacterized protein n=1 Tax=Tanacetum coccineum TaxID=301880 RepID=A0ABQ5A9G7_9ASTR
MGREGDIPPKLCMARLTAETMHDDSEYLKIVSKVGIWGNKGNKVRRWSVGEYGAQAGLTSMRGDIVSDLHREDDVLLRSEQGEDTVRYRVVDGLWDGILIGKDWVCGVGRGRERNGEDGMSLVLGIDGTVDLRRGNSTTRSDSQVVARWLIMKLDEWGVWLHKSLGSTLKIWGSDLFDGEDLSLVSGDLVETQYRESKCVRSHLNTSLTLRCGSVSCSNLYVMLTLRIRRAELVAVQFETYVYRLRLWDAHIFSMLLVLMLDLVRVSARYGDRLDLWIIVFLPLSDTEDGLEIESVRGHSFHSGVVVGGKVWGGGADSWERGLEYIARGGGRDERMSRSQEDTHLERCVREERCSEIMGGTIEIWRIAEARRWWGAHNCVSLNGRI